jgi:branched-chain amino acid transport system substrate-binding protein
MPILEETRMTRIIPALAVLSLLPGAVLAQEIVSLGSASPATGPSAHLGTDTANGARLAVDDLNARSITIGGRKVKFVLQVEDDAGDPKQGTLVAQKLVDAKVVGVVGHLNSGTTVPASKIYASAGIPQISPAATNPSYTRQGFRTTFRVVANDSKLGGLLGRYAVQTFKARKIAVIDDRTAFGQGLADEFIKGVRAAGGPAPVARQFTHDKATDFMAILTQVKAHNPDVIFYGGMDAVAGPMLKQIQALGIPARFMAGDGTCSESLPRLAGDALGEGKVTCAVAGGVSGAQEKVMDDFVARYRQTFKLELQTYAPYAYDAVMVLAQAMQDAGSSDPKAYLPALAKVRYQGVTGMISFEPNGDLANAPITLYTFRNGRKTKMEVIR